ncbi:hypothetical protein [Nocardia sp. AG03]|uniref:Rv1733c family protein n=1 Tax=Nocardia sp. AG03 TaxID=3025312 RepID=UPI0024181D66|nr:hypothetical protein [Nocardia sp. AG03]
MTSSTFRTDAVVVCVRRWWRCLPCSGNPLMRWPDRLAATVRLLGALLVLAAVPIAGALGTAAYSDDAAAIRAERAQAISVEAVILDRPVYTVGHLREAPVRWDGTNGVVERTVPVSRTAAQGDRITVWLDSSGAVTDAPRTPAAAVLNGIGVAATVSTGVALSMWGLVLLTDRAVRHRRDAEWDREWQAMDRTAKGER